MKLNIELKRYLWKRIENLIHKTKKGLTMKDIVDYKYYVFKKEGYK